MLAFDSPSVEGTRPFLVGRPDNKPGFIHILDDFTLAAVLGTVDTISDFVAYLGAKEELLESGKLLMAAGEEELLAHYLKHTGPDGRHCFSIPTKYTHVLFDEGGWEDFQRHPQRAAQIEADQISYEWDGLIEKFTHYATTGGSEFRNYTTIADFERSIRFMAREPRTNRRMLAKALLGIMEKSSTGTERATRIVMPVAPGDPYYVFLALKPPQGGTDAEYRSARRHILQALCMATRARWDDAEDIVGIATEPMESDERSEDLLYLDGRHWTEDAQAEAKQLQEKLGILTKLRLRQYHEKEYPDHPGRSTHPLGISSLRIGRNDPCPCRSGRKYKKCCGRPDGAAT